VRRAAAGEHRGVDVHPERAERLGEQREVGRVDDDVEVSRRTGAGREPPGRAADHDEPGAVSHQQDRERRWSAAQVGRVGHGLTLGIRAGRCRGCVRARSNA